MKKHTFNKTIKELVDLKVIRIDKKGKVHQTKFGEKVYKQMVKDGYLTDEVKN